MATIPEASSHVLQLNRATKIYPGAFGPAVDRLTLSLAQGEIMSILGPSGCGKTTTLRLIAGFETLEEGEVSLRGRVVSTKHHLVPPEKREVAMVFQDYALFPHLTVAKNIAFGLRKMDSSHRRERVATVLELLDMAWLADRYPHQISGGQQQRVALGRALAPKPVVVLLDEPFSNLDASMRGQMRREVQAILRREGATAILVTHDQQEALSFADTIAVMNRGRLEQLGTPEDIYHRPASSFVASFIGHASFIPARVDGEELVTEIGRLSYSGNHRVSEAVVMIRPDDVMITPDESGPGTIVSREFHGSRNFYFIRLASGATIRSRLPSTQVYPVGTRVRVEPRPNANAILFPSSQQGLRPKDEPVLSPEDEDIC